jgi:protein-L-isoaspartate O-methyltransferase
VSKAARDARLEVVRELKRRLFGLDSPASLESGERHGQALREKYGERGLRYVPAAEMPAAVEDMFRRLDLRTGQRLLEVGPGPLGGVALIAAVMGLHVVIVEIDRPFLVDVDRLRQQLEGVAGSEGTLARIAGMRGTLTVSQLDTLHSLIDPYRPLVAAANGSIDVVGGDFADAGVQERVATLGPFDHVVCTDAINPMKDALGTTTAATTTGDAAKAGAVLHGLAAIAGRARTLSMGLVAPEESDDVREEIARMYGVLDRALQEAGRSITYERVIGPSSGSIVRCRLYQLNGQP